jgi:Protein of unknown function (DUF2004)
MALKTIPYFGEIDINNLSAVYDGELMFKDNPVVLDCWFAGSVDGAEKQYKQINDSLLSQLIDSLENLPVLIALADAAYKSDFKEGGETKEDYIDHHLEELDQDVLEKLLVDADTTLSKDRQLLSKLHLVRVGFYPFDPNRFIVFDYKIGKHCTLCATPDEEITNYLVVVRMNDKKEILHVTTES